MEKRKLAVRYAAIAVFVLLCWLPMAWYVAPHLIRSAQEGRSFDFLNHMLGGRGHYTLDGYLRRWSRVALGITLLLGGIAVAGFAALLSPGGVRGVRQRLFQREPALGLAASCTIALSSGLVFGALEVLTKTLKYRVDGVFFEWSNPDALWMIPTGLAALFVLATLLLYGLGAVPQRRLALRSLLFVLFSLGVLGLLLALKRSGIHPIAKVVLALGIGYQLARLLSRRGDALLRYANTAGALVAGGTLIAFIGLHPVRHARERSRMAAVTADPARPNVLLVVLDAVRAGNLQIYGYPRPTTPHLARLSERGTVFDRAYSAAPWTLPSHASLMTGRWYNELSSDWVHTLDDAYPTLAGFLSEHGYVTGGFVGNLIFTTHKTGLARGFTAYRDHQLDLPTWLESAEMLALATKAVRALVPGGPRLFARKYATDVNRELLSWLDDVGPRPFFAFLNYFDAHDPYERFPRFLDAFPPGYARDSLVTGPNHKELLSDEEQSVIDRYDSAIAFMDDALGHLLDALEAKGLLRNTLVIVTSDHGEQFLEHGLEGHSNSLYSPLIHVPLVAVLPGTVPQGVRIARPFSLRDMAATITDLAGLAPTPFPGSSLRRAWTTADTTSEDILSEANPYALSDFDGPIKRGPMKSLVLGSLHYIRNGDGAEELYDISVDPWEVDDLAGTDRGRALLPGLRQTLRAVHDAGRFRNATWSAITAGKGSAGRAH